MKIINIISQIFLITLVCFLSYFWFGSYRSAFEADQDCHFQLSSKVKDTFGCDHDTETHQWILYEKQENSNPAKVIKRFRYRLF